MIFLILNIKNKKDEKNFLKTAIVGFIFLMPTGLIANHETVTVDEEIYRAICKIKDKRGGKTFKARGDCDKVQKAYENWLKLVEK